MPNSNFQKDQTRNNDDQVNQAIIETINSNMRKAGYHLDRENPDLLVLVSTKTNREEGVTTDPVYASYPYTPMASTIRPFYEPFYYTGFTRLTRIVGYDTDTYQYKEGTLVINLVDRQTQETVWKGIATENIYNQGTTSAIQELVNEIFEKYPLTD